NQLLRVFARVCGIAHAVAKIDLHITADHPTQLLKGFCERRIAFLGIGVGRNRSAREHADAPHLLLLRARRKRPRRSHTAEQRDEVAAFHSITSSARASSIGGISKPRRLAVLRLITNSNFVDWITGRSVGLAPLRMRPVLMPISW